jgi:class I fructose-bisphosphate aldolase
MLGKLVRMNRLFNSGSGNILVIALDHAVGWGVIPGIEDMKKTMEKIIESAPDAITMLKGTAQQVFRPYAGTIPFILKCTTFAPYHPQYDTLVAGVDEAVRLGADAIAVGATLCGEHQAELLTQLGRITAEAELVGMPTVTHIYPKGAGAEGQYAEENVKYAARAAAELNVDIVKTFYTGDPVSYKRVVEACSSALVVSGGPKLPSMRDMFQMTFDAMSAGARGVTYGRNVWQAEDPVRVVKALKRIIHENGSVDEAMEIAGQK